MTCAHCGSVNKDDGPMAYCVNPICPYQAVSVPNYGWSEPIAETISAEPAPGESWDAERVRTAADRVRASVTSTPPMPFEVFRMRAAVLGPTTLTFCFNGEGEGQVAFTYAEMLALQRVARAQIELEKKRGVNQ